MNDVQADKLMENDIKYDKSIVPLNVQSDKDHAHGPWYHVSTMIVTYHLWPGPSIFTTIFVLYKFYYGVCVCILVFYVTCNDISVIDLYWQAASSRRGPIIATRCFLINLSSNFIIFDTCISWHQQTVCCKFQPNLSEFADSRSL